ncbi:MAG: hypothetical protein K6G88_15630 [Lachnospiraceae bacterium]|nr:hypothetical protein [Lachnospiraceae bacterium]
MPLSDILKNKKVKNAIVTIIEIVIVAAIIMSGLMFVRSKLTGQSFGVGNVEQKKASENKKAEEQKKQEIYDKYLIQINIKKSAVIIYQQNKKKTDKKAVKVMKASIGSKVKKGQYKLFESYEWRNTNITDNIWNKYNFRYSDNAWLQSADYSDKYSWCLKASSYKKIGKSQKNNKNIQLYAGDAAWIFNNCGTGTVVEIVKGKKEDKLPLEISQTKDLYDKCGWDPTDIPKGNPYKKAANGAVSYYGKYVYVEKGDTADYYANIIALSASGKVITDNLSHDTLDTSSVGKRELNYYYKAKSGTEFKATIKYKIIDTTPPVIKIPDKELEYEMKDVSDGKVKKEKVKNEIEKLVEDACSSNEGKIVVSAFPKEELKKGINYVNVVATDDSGNIGSAQVAVKIIKQKKEKDEKKDKKEKTTKKSKDKNNSKDNKGNKNTDKKKSDKLKEKETTKKQKETAAKVKETTKAQNNQNETKPVETTSVAETFSEEETQ